MTVTFNTNSIFIPSIHRSVDAERLAQILACLGQVERCDFVEMTTKKMHWRRVFVHFASMENLPEFQTSSSEGEFAVKLYYFVTISGLDHLYTLQAFKNDSTFLRDGMKQSGVPYQLSETEWRIAPHYPQKQEPTSCGGYGEARSAGAEPPTHGGRSPKCVVPQRHQLFSPPPPLRRRTNDPFEQDLIQSYCTDEPDVENGLRREMRAWNEVEEGEIIELWCQEV